MTSKPPTPLTVIAVVAVSTIAAYLVWFLLSQGDDNRAVAAFDPPQFIEESSSAGLEHVYDGDFTFFTGGGVAVFDCDGDRKPDLFLAGGANPSALYRNSSSIGDAIRFTNVTMAATGLRGVTGAYPINVDGDDHLDLVVLRLGENVVLRGTGECGFEPANSAWNVDGGDAWTAAFSAKWEQSAELPTLAFGNYLHLDENGQQRGACADNYLLRPGAAGYDPAIPLSPGWCTLSILFSDWDRSGNRDLRITNDRQYYRDGQEQLWAVPDGQEPRLYTEEEGWRKVQIFGMGIASQDVTGDGLPELFLTSMGDNKLQALEGGSAAQPNYGDIAFGLGATAHRPFVGDDLLPSTAWHAEFQDVNNDGFMDLYVSKGNVEAMVEFAAEDPNNLLLGQPDGRFIEAADRAGIINLRRTRGAALADFNLDGMLDLVEVNRRENVTLWRNVGSGDAASPAAVGNWVAVRLQQSVPNRDAIGSWIEVKVGARTVERELTIGGGHAGGQLGWVHFGLGTADRAEIRIQWPDGETGPWLQLEQNTFNTIARGAPEPEPWDP